jgi:seryl-tRNA synthetase
MKAKLFKDETKEFLDYEIQTLRTELTKNDTRKDKLYKDYELGAITADFVGTRMKRIEERQDEIKLRLEELEAERKLYDEKIGKSIQIIDNLKSWRKKWDKASDEKKNEMLKLMTIKILAVHHKTEVGGKEHEWKDLQIVWNEEFGSLFELGVFEKAKKKNPHNPDSSGGNPSLNRDEIKHVLSDIEELAISYCPSRKSPQGTPSMY